ncbi:MAG: SAM-dependent methyltransferase [Ilumatobacteraceae bacterium]|nr:SAM-dependent methyltransferase [Ilumatobacteraceae bacterium]
MPSASDEVRAAIVAAGGAIRFDEFMRIALYGDHGFYATGGQAGRRGDFITSPEVGPLFGTVLARWIEAEYHRIGEPSDFTIVECGAGPGTLARSVLAVAPQWRDRYVAVEISDSQRRQHPDGVRSLPKLAELNRVGPINGVVIANELLDNLPFRLAVFDGRWREIAVSLGRDSEFVESTMKVGDEWRWLPIAAPHGARLPVQDEAAAWVSTAQSLLRQGSVKVFDYCTPVTADLAGRPWREWLRTYRAQERGEHYLRLAGEQDITAQVCIDQLPTPWGIETQVSFLKQFGIDELVEDGRRHWAAAAARPDLAAMAMRSRVSEAEALTESPGLGAFTSVTWQLPVAHATSGEMSDSHSTG